MSDGILERTGALRATSLILGSEEKNGNWEVKGEFAKELAPSRMLERSLLAGIGSRSLKREEGGGGAGEGDGESF